MRVTLVLPDFQTVPVGGLKVAYELANRLSRRGHRVTVVHFATMSHAPMARRLGLQARFRAWRMGIGGWFSLDRGVAAALLDERDLAELPDGDVIVGCGWRTVRFVEEAPPRTGRKRYFAQGYMADVEGGIGEVDAAWRRPVPKIVTSSWLERKARELAGPDAAVWHVPIAIDHDAYRVSVQPRDRIASAVAMLGHGSPLKGTDDGIAALEIARLDAPDLRLTIFGTDERPRSLPGWATYVRQPSDLATLYNSVAIFVHPSRLEGWPLTPAEAMACGCALAAYANDGVREYAVDQQNALLVPIGDVEALAAAVTNLIRNEELRLRLARQGVEDIGGYTWDRSVTEFETALQADPRSS